VSQLDQFIVVGGADAALENALELLKLPYKAFWGFPIHQQEKREIVAVRAFLAF